MASPTNAATTLNIKGIREDLENTIYRVAPEEVPFTTTIGGSSAKQHYHEWQTQGLDAPNPNPTQYQGQDASPESPNFTSRLGNYVQHFERSFQVASVLADVTLAGRASELNEQTVLKGIAQKTDIESRFLGNYASSPEIAGTTPYAAAGALAFVHTNTSRNTGGLSGGFANGIVAAATNASSTRTFTETLLKSSMNQLFSSTGKMGDRVAFMSPSVKQEAATMTGIALNRRDTGNKRAVIVGGADVYVSDFGDITFVPSIYCSQRDVLIVDPTNWAIGTLRGMTTEDLAKSGDSDKRMIVCDKTLVAKNEKAAAVIADVS